MQPTEKNIEIGGHSVTLQTGKVAKQASGAVMVSCGGTVVLVTAQAAKDAKPGGDFLPLTVDYQEKMSAAGRIPGGFFKREGKPRDEETLISRMVDRSIRPLFADGWCFETQLIATVFSADPKHPADALALTGASLALQLSDIPFLGPIAGLRVCRLDGEFRINPSYEEREAADINMFVACSRDAIIMVEGGGLEMSEADAIDALLFAHESARVLLDAQDEMQREAGKEKREVPPIERDEELAARVRDVATPKLQAAYQIREKLPRYAALDQAKQEVVEALVDPRPA